MGYSTLAAKYRDSLSVRELEALELIGSSLASTNEKFNLTSLTDEKSVSLLHFWDSLKLLDTGLFAKAKVIDVGCGGGFPSLPLALCAPDCEIFANDATEKKLIFVSETARKAGITNLKTLPGRAEELSRRKEYRAGFDISVSRGVARLNVLCEWCLPFVKQNGFFIAMKGEKGQDESAEAANAIKTLGGELVDIMQYTVPEYGYLHTLVIIRKIASTPAEYPRLNGKILKNPL